jgi:hypothetical protein
MKSKFILALLIMLLISSLYASDPWGEPSVLSGSMTLMAQVNIDSSPASPGDVLAAFVQTGAILELRGKSHVMQVDGISGCLMQIYTETDNEEIIFRVWDESESSLCLSTQSIDSQQNGIVGSYPDSLFMIDSTPSTTLEDPWAEPTVLTGSMVVMAEVYIDSNPATTDDILAAFAVVDGVEQLRGKAEIMLHNGIPGCLLNVFTNTNAEEIIFKVWDYSAQQIFNDPNSISSEVEGVIGSYPAEMHLVATGSVIQRASSPQFSTPEGTYTNPQSISLLCQTPGATIRYTTDGSYPDIDSAIYVQEPIAIPLHTTTTIRARAFIDAWIPSPFSSATYVVTGSVADPEFSLPGGIYTEAQSVELSCLTPGAEIRYTTDYSEPDQGSPIYSQPIEIQEDTILKAKAYFPDWQPSATVFQVYTITGTVAAPIFSPSPGFYPTLPIVTINCPTPGALIRFTTNGMDPSDQSNLYSEPIYISESTLIKARAYRDDWTPSPMVSGFYEITGTVETPVISPPGGEYEDEIEIEISCGNPQSQIYYTLDGTEPTQACILYSGSFSLDNDAMVKAKAFLTGWIPSAIAEENYQFPNSSANGNQAPLVTGISSVYPNPFKDILTIELAIKEGIRDYSFKIYNLRGECVFSSPGVAKNAFKLSWDGKARDGSKLPAGVYLIRFKTKEHLNTKRVILY